MAMPYHKWEKNREKWACT